jgi:hypothetical protein
VQNVEAIIAAVPAGDFGVDHGEDVVVGLYTLGEDDVVLEEGGFGVEVGFKGGR